MKLLKISAAATAIIGGFWINSATAEFSANVGLVSDYYFRGILQNESATASAGIDYENGGFYAGTWMADVIDGVEVDFYGGYGAEMESGFSYSVGVTTYQYTGNFDTGYNEVNVNLGFGLFSLEVTKGEQDDVDEGEYTFFGLSLEKGDFYGTVGSWGGDFEGEYVELGRGKEIGGFDAGVAFIANSKELGVLGTGNERLVFSLGKSFDL